MNANRYEAKGQPLTAPSAGIASLPRGIPPHSGGNAPRVPKATPFCQLSNTISLSCILTNGPSLASWGHMATIAVAEPMIERRAALPLVGQILKGRYVVLEELMQTARHALCAVYDLSELRRLQARIERTGPTIVELAELPPETAATTAPPSPPTADLVRAPRVAPPPPRQLRVATPITHATDHQAGAALAPVTPNDRPHPNAPALSEGVASPQRVPVTEPVPTPALTPAANANAFPAPPVHTAAETLAPAIPLAPPLRESPPHPAQTADQHDRRAPPALPSVVDVVPLLRPRVRTRQIEAAWFAQSDHLDDVTTEQIQEGEPLVPTVDLVAQAQQLSPDQLKRWALDVTTGKFRYFEPEPDSPQPSLVCAPMITEQAPAFRASAHTTGLGAENTAEVVNPGRRERMLDGQQIFETLTATKGRVFGLGLALGGLATPWLWSLLRAIFAS